MNNNNRNYFSAAILIVLGVLFLGKEFNLFNIHWDDIFKFWPLLLVGMGLNMLFGGNVKGNSSVIILICLLAIPFSMLRSCNNEWNKGTNNFNWDKNWNHDEDDDQEDEDDKDDENDKNNTSEKYSKSQNFSEDMEPAIKTAKLTLEGGVAGIDIDGTTSKLFEADTKSTISDFSVSKTINNGVANINFTMNSRNEKGKESNINIGDNNKNEAIIKLNPTIEWNMDYKFGVSGADLDLSPFNVKTLNIKTGVSGVDLKLGDKANDLIVDIDAGIAGINIKVPTAMGVRVKTDSFLSDNNFEGFTESNGYHLSPGYEKATKKITINYNGAFSSFDVERY